MVMSDDCNDKECVSPESPKYDFLQSGDEVVDEYDRPIELKSTFFFQNHSSVGDVQQCTY